jgi:UDP-glucose 4-epimerase
MSRVLITGVAGFLGSHLADKFLQEGWDVVGIDNLIGGYEANVPKGVEWHNLDLTLPSSRLDDAFASVDLVVHAACTAYEGLSVFSPSLIVNNTVMSTTNALGAAVRSGVSRFVYLSSMARYGDHKGEVFTETMETKPQDPYGIAKEASEKIVRNLCEVHEMEWVILVPHNIIGPRQKYDDPFRNVASIMMNRMLQGKPPIIYSDGSQQRCFSYITDVVEPLYTACLLPEAVGEVINIGPDEETVTIKHLSELISEIMEFEGDPIYVPGRPNEVPFASCSSDKARTLLSYQTKVGLREALELMARWIKSNGSKEFDYHLPVEIETSKTPKTWTKRMI